MSRPPDLDLQPVNGDEVTVAEPMTMFHLVLVVVDPHAVESSWILETAERILVHFRGADCRAAWLVTGDEKAARDFPGPLADEMLTFVDPDRAVVRALGLEELPAFVHVGQDLSLENAAQGWNPEEWRSVADNLAGMRSWNRPVIPVAGDPVGNAGTPARA